MNTKYVSKSIRIFIHAKQTLICGCASNEWLFRVRKCRVAGTSREFHGSALTGRYFRENLLFSPTCPAKQQRRNSDERAGGRWLMVKCATPGQTASRTVRACLSPAEMQRAQPRRCNSASRCLNPPDRHCSFRASRTRQIATKYTHAALGPVRMYVLRRTMQKRGEPTARREILQCEYSGWFGWGERRGCPKGEPLLWHEISRVRSPCAPRKKNT